MADVIIFSGGQKMPEDYPRIQRSLGPYRISSALHKHGYSSTVIDSIQYLSLGEIINSLEKVLTPETLWVGISSSFLYDPEAKRFGLERMYQNISYSTIRTIYEFVKTNSNAKIVFGGARALQAHSDPLVDYYVAGYGDNSIIELTDFLSGKIPELSNKTLINIDGSERVLIDSGKYPEPQMNNLDTFWNKKEFNLLPNEAVPIEFARGCIFKCKFCNYPLLGKKKGTYIRDMDQVKDEMIQLWETNGTDSFYITDDTFNDDNDKMEAFHKMFTSLPFKPKFAAFLRLDLIDRFPHQADLLLESGLIGNFFGIESFNHKSAQAIGKGLHPNRVKDRLNWVREKWNGKVNTTVGLIVGLPYDNEKYFQELDTYLSSSEYPAQKTVINPLHIFDKSKGVNLYGSEFSMNAEIYGYKFDSMGKWYHEEQNFNFDTVSNVANYFGNKLYEKNMVSSFEVLTYMNIGIPLEDILKYTEVQLQKMYNIPELNNKKLTMYKQMIGAI